ncbi:MAG: sialidase family protein [Pirellulaceae bacterium]|nr:sialidase family protein [Pirellulaceae bacterium]
MSKSLTKSSPKPLEQVPKRLWIQSDDAGGIHLEAASAVEGDKPPLRRFSMTAYTGGAMQLSGWRYPVVVDLAGLRVPKKSRPILKDHDGGQTWGPVQLVEALQTPVCQGNILRYSWREDADRGGKSRILYCSPAGQGRTHLTIHVSYDEGKTWPVNKLVHAGGSAYSNMIVLPNGKIGILFEKDGYQTISFTIVTLAWLEDGDA